MVRFRISRKRLLYAMAMAAGGIFILLELFFLSPSVRAVAVDGAEQVGADGFLVARLEDRDLKVRSSAKQALVRRGPRAVPALVEGLNNPHPGNRSIAAATLGAIGPSAVDAIPALKRVAIEDPDESVLEAAGDALGIVARDNSAVVAELLIMLSSPADNQRLAAIRAAACLNDARAVEPLTASLSHPNAKVREEAAESLGKLKQLATPAIPALLEGLKDPAPEVRSEAREALGKIAKAEPSLPPELAAKVKQALEAAPARIPPRTAPEPAPKPDDDD